MNLLFYIFFTINKFLVFFKSLYKKSVWPSFSLKREKKQKQKAGKTFLTLNFIIFNQIK